MSVNKIIDDIDCKIEELNAKKERIAKNIKSFKFVLAMLYKEYSENQNEVDYLETTLDIKQYKKYTDLKQQLEKLKENNLISNSKYLKDMTDLSEKYSKINVGIVASYITNKKKAKSFKSQYMEIECTKAILEKQNCATCEKLNLLINKKDYILKNQEKDSFRFDSSINDAKIENDDSINSSIIMDNNNDCVDIVRESLCTCMD